MNNLYFLRKDNNTEPFKPDEVKSLLSSDFEIVEIRTNADGYVDDLVLKPTKHPELMGLDPITKGVCISVSEEGGYWMDPRFFMNNDEAFDEVIQDLMIDLELEYDFDKML